LTGDDGVVAETTMANIGFFDGAGVVWPVAPMRRTAVRVRDISSFEGAFLANARGLPPSARWMTYACRCGRIA